MRPKQEAPGQTKLTGHQTPLNQETTEFSWHEVEFVLFIYGSEYVREPPEGLFNSWASSPVIQ